MHHARQAVILGSSARIAYDIIAVENILHAKLYRAALIELIAGDKVYRQQITPATGSIRSKHACQRSIEFSIMVFDAGIVLLTRKLALPNTFLVFAHRITEISTQRIAVFTAGSLTVAKVKKR